MILGKLFNPSELQFLHLLRFYFSFRRITGELKNDVLFTFYCLRTESVKSPFVNPGNGHLTKTETGMGHSLLKITGAVDGAVQRTQVLFSCTVIFSLRTPRWKTIPLSLCLLNSGGNNSIFDLCGTCYNFKI